MTALRRARAAQDRLEREHVGRPVEVGRVQVEPQHAAGRQRGRADRERGAADRHGGGEAPRGRGRRTAAASPTSRSRPPARGAARACRRTRARRTRAARRRRARSTRRPAAMLACVCARSMPANSASGRRTCLGPRPRHRFASPRWRKPCWAIASPRSRQSSSQAARSGRRWKNGWRSGAGITSSVARSTPWSSSQSRISAQRSNVAGSTSWIATAMLPLARHAVRRSAPRPLAKHCKRASAPRLPAGGQPAERGCPTCARGTAASPPRASRSRIAREPARPATAAASGSGRAGQRKPVAAVGDQLSRAAVADGDDRQPAGLRLEHDLAEGVGARAEEQHVGGGVGGRERLALEPAEESSRASPSRARSRSSSGPPPASTEVEPRVARPRAARNASREQVDALLAREPARVQDRGPGLRGRPRGFAGVKRSALTPRSQRAIRAGVERRAPRASRRPRPRARGRPRSCW